MIMKNSITKQVIDYFKNQISNETWIIGCKIPSENETSKLLGVSRASVRMAIQQFIALGVLESRHGKGTFVISNDLSGFGRENSPVTQNEHYTLKQMMEFRRIIETETAYLAAERADEKNIERMQYCVDQMKACAINKDSDSFVLYDSLFHEELSKATENQLIVDAVKQIFVEKIRHQQQFNQIFGYKDGIYYHTVILQAIKDANANKARRLMREHMQKAIDDLNLTQKHEE